MYALFYIIFYVVLLIIDGILGTTAGSIGLLVGLYSLAFFLPSLAVSVRRLHDTDRSGWWILIGLIPIVGGIVLLVFMVQDSTPGDNQFGQNPKMVTA